MKLLSIAIALFFSTTSFASTEIGVGMTSATGGRTVPSLAAAVSTSTATFSAFSTGVQSEYYYQSTYGLSYFWTWKPGHFISGPIQAGFGVGSFFSERGFQESDETDLETKSDFGIGLALRMNWTPFSIVYVNLECTFGLRNLGSHLILNFQDMVSFSIGIRI